MKKQILRLLFFIFLCLSVGWLGGLATQSSLTTWYAGLQKPPLNPPDWIFAPVWTALYLLMAFAGWRLWGVVHPKQILLRFFFIAQLTLNGIWSFLFFALRNPFAALMDILILWSSVFVLIEKLRQVDRLASGILLPYLLWLSFAVYLNAAIFWLNR